MGGRGSRTSVSSPLWIARLKVTKGQQQHFPRGQELEQALGTKESGVAMRSNIREAMNRNQERETEP